ncbi:MAG: calcium:proton antiporter [Steroidobacteraceae bacterium]
MRALGSIPLWSVVGPLACWLLVPVVILQIGGIFGIILLGAALVAAVICAVHHAEVVAHKVGEPFGTLVLALAVTLIEVALIVTLMLAGGAETQSLARDTVFATIMIILNGLVGLCLLIGGRHFGEQSFSLHGVSAALVTLAAITFLTLVLPNYTTSVTGPYYSSGQLSFVAVVSLILYATFIFVQTVRHRDYFLPVDTVHDEEQHAPPPNNRTTLASTLLLMVTLTAVVVAAKTLAPTVEAAVQAARAPATVVGIIIASIILMPEGYAAVRAARRNRLQTSLNLTLGSALASIGLTIPAVAVISLAFQWPLSLGLASKETLLLALSLFIAALSLNTGRTTVLQGVVHLVIFAVYLFIAVVP